MASKDYDIVAWGASSMSESLRAVGCIITTDIADLIDNAIMAEARNVWLDFYWPARDSYLTLRDDNGEGMTAADFVDAKRPGNLTYLEVCNAGDLGRFDSGLKMASFSQVRHFPASEESRTR